MNNQISNFCRTVCLYAVIVAASPVFAEDVAQQPATPMVENAPTPSAPAPVQTKRADIVVRQLSSIEFGTFTSEQGGGSITISPTGARMPGGNVSILNTGFSGAADFEIVGQPEETVIIYLPERVNLNKDNGGGGAIITKLTISPATTVTLDAQGRARVKVGGTLQLPGSIAQGSYSGAFDIDVRYLR